jgi:ATP-dependent Clp protease ATP-binding subunit ClpC
LARRFQVVWVEEPTREAALWMLRGVAESLARHHGVAIEPAAIESAIDLSIRYLPDTRLPDKAVELLDEACASARVMALSIGDAGGPPLTIGREQVAAIVAQRTGVPVERLTASDAQRLLNMEAELERRVVGQPEALSLVGDAVRTARAGLKDPRRPVGVFLFAGATGTGKTELAKALAAFLYGDEDRLARFDMSEYQEKHSISRLLGAPPGYIGHDEEGQLSRAIRTHPSSVLLFDEVEKAHPEVLDVFLQIFDDGRLTDTHGRLIVFNECLIILTSNLGTSSEDEARLAAHPLGFGAAPSAREQETPTQYRQRILSAVQRTMRPELVNRLTATAIFYPLSRASIRGVVDKILHEVRERLAGPHLTLDLADEVYDYLAQRGYSPRFGARELERVVQRELLQPLARALLAGQFPEGTTVRVETTADGLQLVGPA